jgi:hypothetical protein
MFYGDYGTSLQEYQAVLGMPASSDETGAAQLGAARARLLVGDGAATETLEAFIANSPGDPHIAEAWFLLGQARAGTGDYSGAVEAYRQYQKLRGDVIAPMSTRGSAMRASEPAATSCQAYRAALAMPSNIILDCEKSWLAHSGCKRHARRLAQYDAILAVAQSASYRWRIQTLAIRHSITPVRLGRRISAGWPSRTNMLP